MDLGGKALLPGFPDRLPAGIVTTLVIWYIMLKLLLAWNGSCPVSNWYITTPSE